MANSIILNLYGKAKQNAAFNSLRILEDFYYQAGVRQDLIQVKWNKYGRKSFKSF